MVDSFGFSLSSAYRLHKKLMGTTEGKPHTGVNGSSLNMTGSLLPKVPETLIEVFELQGSRTGTVIG